MPPHKAPRAGPAVHAADAQVNPKLNGPLPTEALGKLPFLEGLWLAKTGFNNKVGCQRGLEKVRPTIDCII